MKFIFVDTKNADFGLRQDSFKKKGSDISQISIAPDSDHIPAAVGKAKESLDRVVADADDLCKSSYGQVDIFRQGNKTVRFHAYIFLHKTVKTAGPKLTASEIIFCNDVVLFSRSIRNHYNKSSLFKLACGVESNPADCLMDESHWKLFAKDIFCAETLVITLVSIADRQADRMNNHVRFIKGNVIKDQFKLTWSD